MNTQGVVHLNMGSSHDHFFLAALRFLLSLLILFFLHFSLMNCGDLINNYNY